MPSEIRRVGALVGCDECLKPNAKVSGWHNTVQHYTKSNQQDHSYRTQWESLYHGKELEADKFSSLSSDDLLGVILHAIRGLSDASTQDLVRFIRQGASATRIAEHANLMLSRDTQNMHDRSRSLQEPKL